MPQPADKSRILLKENPYFANPLGYPNSINAAINAAMADIPDGGIIEFGPGLFYLSEPLATTSSKAFTFRGAGRSGSAASAATRIIFHGHTAFVNQGRCRYEDFALIHSEHAFTGLPNNTVGVGSPTRQWRPNRSHVVGTHIVGVRCPWRKAEIDAGRPWNWGVSFRCSRANGSTTPGASGLSGSTEPSWPYGSPKIGAGDVFTFTVNTGTDVITATGSAYPAGQRVRVYTPDGTLPAPLAINTTYYVRDQSGATFKLAATSGGAAIDLTTAGSGTLQVFRQAFAVEPIVDGELEWTPVLVHGIEVKASCHIDNIHFERIPGNAVNIDASVLAAQVPNTIDPRLGFDYGNASLAGVHRCSMNLGGGSGIFLNQFDASVVYTSNNDLRENHGYGIYDNSSFGGIHIANHSDGNEEGYYWGRTGFWFGNYNEAQYGTFGAPTMKTGAKWYCGAADKFTGIMQPQPTTLARGTLYTVGAAVKLPVDNGYHYICVEEGTTHATVQPEYTTGISWYLSATEQGIAITADSYQIIVDGTAKFRCWASSEISDADIDGALGNPDKVFTNRYQQGRFWAGGRGNGLGVMAFAGSSSIDNSGTVYDLVWNTTHKTWQWLRGISTRIMEIAGEACAIMPAGRIGFANGIHLGGSALSAWPRVIYTDAVPANGSEVQGTLALHADCTSGQPLAWTAKADGTWAAWPNMP